MKVCHRCYWENENHDVRCLQCFEELPKRPTHRGKPSGEGFNVEAKLAAVKAARTADDFESTTAEPFEVTVPRRDLGRGLILAAVLVGLTLSLGVLALRAVSPHARNDPRGAAQLFLDAVFTQSPEVYKPMLTTGSRSRALSAEMLLGHEVFNASRMGKNTTAVVGDATSSSDTIRAYRYRLETDLWQEDGEEHMVYENLEIVLKLEEGEWRVDLTLTAGRKAYKARRDGEGALPDVLQSVPRESGDPR